MFATPEAVLLAQLGGDPAWWVGSTHFPRLDPGLRAEASARLLQLAEGLSAPWVLCGDFNQPATAWLPETAVVAPNPPVATYPTRAPTEAIDYCLVGGATAKAQALHSTASDHWPILIDATISADI